MKTNIILGILIGALIAALNAGIAGAQTVSGSQTIAANQLALTSLDSIESGRQAIMSTVNAELSGAALEVADLPSMPRETINERGALIEEYGALATRLASLENIVQTLAQMEAEESAMAALIKNNALASGNGT